MTTTQRTTRPASKACGTQPAGRQANRRGLAAVWLVLSIPLFVAVLGFVLNLGFLWLARTQMNNAAASGALAGVQAVAAKQKQTGGSQPPAAEAAREFVESNFLHGKRLKVGPSGQSGNRRACCRARVLMGSVRGRTFQIADGDSGPAGRDACLVQLSSKVTGPLGWLTGPQTVQVTAVAVIGNGKPRLVEIDEIRGPGD